ncbi:uncharacterized protein V6R79_020080 [Siganus canaliculatus]
MEDLDDNISSTAFEPLFIKEDEVGESRILMEHTECPLPQSGCHFTESQLNQSTLMKPYLQEMDDLLKRCEELTGIPFGSHFSANCSEPSLTDVTHGQSKDEDAMDSNQAYLSTCYIDTKMDGAGTEDRQVQGQSQGLGSITNRCGVSTNGPGQMEMPLSSVGNKLSDTMVEYEGQLLGILAMLENCMEESGMDFEPRDWSEDASQEYVHISKNPSLYRGTTLVPIPQGRPVKLETQPMQFESWAGNFSPHEGIPDAGISSSEHGPMPKEPAEREYITTNEDAYMKGEETGADVNNKEWQSEEELKMANGVLISGNTDLGELGSQMEACIDEVQQLEKRRKELLAQVLELRGNEGGQEPLQSDQETEASIDDKVEELMKALKMEEEGRREERKREIQSLKEERAVEERSLWKVNLERQGLLEGLREHKRRLFAMAKDCAQNQFALNVQRREVEQLKSEQERLESFVLRLTEEGSQLRTSHQQQLSNLQAELQAWSSSQTLNTQDELAQCRRHSCGDIQQYVEGGLKVLEDRYEPVLLGLLKRREATAEALGKAKEQAQELRVQLRPLEEEIQKLNLQRACLEEKLKLILIHRKEAMEQRKETIYCLEETSRELKTELNIQKRKTKEIEDLRDSLSQELLLYRAVIEDHNKCHKEKT